MLDRHPVQSANNQGRVTFIGSCPKYGNKNIKWFENYDTKIHKKLKNETCRGQLLPHHGEWTIECPFFRRITSDAHDSPKWGVLRIPHDGHRRKDVLQYRNLPTCACLVPSKKKDDAPLIFNGPKTCCQHPPLSNSTIIQFIIMGDLFSVFCEHTNLSFLKKDLLWWAGCLQHTRQ